jgi:signal transduction histidine kinase
MQTVKVFTTTNFQYLLNLTNVRPMVAMLSIVFFCISTFWGFSIQYQYGILYHFSYGNMVILALSVLYFISLCQYFLLRDNAFWYYLLYLVFNISYYHYAVFFGENPDIVVSLPSFIQDLSGAFLITTYFLYALFTIHFLNLKIEHPKFEKKLRLCAYMYLGLIAIHFILPVLFNDPKHAGIVSFLIIFFCIPIAIYGIGSAFITLSGRLARIFFLGTSFYFIGSVFGFLFATGTLINPLTNQVMKNWTFFTQTGTLIEVIFFSSGLAYRMRLIEIQKNRIEQELLKEKLKELQVQNELIKQRERISHDLHDDVGGTLNSISVFSEIAKQQLCKNHPETTPLLDRIGDASRHLIDTINDIVWAVNPKNDKFENITLRMQLFVADLLMSKNIIIDFHSDTALNSINLSVEKRKHFYLIFKEAINNVYKYAECSALKIEIRLCETNICMTIADNGKGFDGANTKNGNGLTTMNERAKILRGVFDINTKLNIGTTLNLCFPIEDDDFDKLHEGVVKDIEKESNFELNKSKRLVFVLKR